MNSNIFQSIKHEDLMKLPVPERVKVLQAIHNGKIVHEDPYPPASERKRFED